MKHVGVAIRKSMGVAIRSMCGCGYKEAYVPFFSMVTHPGPSCTNRKPAHPVGRPNEPRSTLQVFIFLTILNRKVKWTPFSRLRRNSLDTDAASLPTTRSCILGSDSNLVMIEMKHLRMN